MELDAQPGDDGPPRLLSVPEVAALAGVSEQAIRLQLTSGGLAGQRVLKGRREVWAVPAEAARRYASRHGRLSSLRTGTPRGDGSPGRDPVERSGSPRGAGGWRRSPDEEGVTGGGGAVPRPGDCEGAAALRADRDAAAHGQPPADRQRASSGPLPRPGPARSPAPGTGRRPATARRELVGAAQRMLGAHRRLLESAVPAEDADPEEQALREAYSCLIEACGLLLEGYA